MNSAVADGRGGWYIAGLVPVRGRLFPLARLTATGRLERVFTTTEDAEIHSLIRDGAVLYAGGAHGSRSV